MLAVERRRGSEEGGFTLIELLVVILIIGILAAIAIPSFLNQKSKASDASAKELARTAQTTAETYATDHQGSYSGLSATALNSLEPSIPITTSTTNSYVDPSTGVTVLGGGTGYTVTATSEPGGNTYSVTNNAGVVTRTCAVNAPSPGGCVADAW